MHTYIHTCTLMYGIQAKTGRHIIRQLQVLYDEELYLPYAVDQQTAKDDLCNVDDQM